jgi:L,D-transpeptidase ErfK/SrfK
MTSFLHWICAVLIAAALAVFGFETWSLSRAATELRQTANQLEETSLHLDQGAREIAGVAAQTKEQSKELEFLQGLQNLLPHDKGFVRTQKAMLEDVEALRRKVGQRLKDKLHIVVDTKANKLYLKKGLTLVMEADCSVGRGGSLIDRQTGRRWEFVTPRGQFEVLNKIKNPLWIKPDWAFVESKQPVPPPEDPSRKVEGELGAYLLNLGDGYLIHGTKNEELLGRAVSHGCVRVGAADLEKLYEAVPVGTMVYIY